MLSYLSMSGAMFGGFWPLPEDEEETQVTAEKGLPRKPPHRLLSPPIRPEWGRVTQKSNKD